MQRQQNWILTFTVFNLLRASQEKVMPELPQDTSSFLITDNLIVKYQKKPQKKQSDVKG